MDHLSASLNDLSSTAREALLSGTWIYPVQGLLYFIAHPSLYHSVAPVLGKSILVSLGITAGMFVFTYLPQVAFCAIFSGPLAFLPAAVMVLGESYVLISLVTKIFFLEAAKDKIFDAVLLQQGHESLVARGRVVKAGQSSGIKTLGKSITKPLNRFTKEGIIRYLISIPLNSIPVVGTVIFLLFNGRKSGPNYHARYFQLKGVSGQTRNSFIESRKGEYTAFGAAAFALDLVPIVGMAFNITSTVGAALWASNMEKRSGQSAGETDQVDVKME
ncbi:hypothetical protein Moror_6617 [Moniliophthora roreri MCA 2997]|uniref:Outer spore wall protein RRT8 n=1 Tax=Moniliophthora roreri (strain MCA 2997) TaxID=1381753 RepID=V2XVC1_MONRO|nr:hypothetical protein Moror_6617 [Moniliophthora roreri MCA 2997]